MGEELWMARTLSHRQAPPRSQYRCDDRTIIRAVTPRATASSLTPTQRAASEGRLGGAGLRVLGQEVCLCVCVSVCECRKQTAHLQAGTEYIFLSAFTLRFFTFLFFCITGRNNDSGLLLFFGPVISRFLGTSSEPGTPHVQLRVSSWPDLFLTCKEQ